MSLSDYNVRMNQEFEAVIGLEIHAQVATKTKMFCGCSSNAYNAEPNEHTCPVCMGFPGQLPVVNAEAVKKGIMAAIALNCHIPEVSKFDRKNYFYPDLPKGFQISQFDKPVSEKGSLKILVNGEERTIGITRLHLEDDAGKLSHIDHGTLCDYNRSGIGLMEIVSDPDIRNAEEAVAYAKEIQIVLRYVGSSEADMEKGMMRFDASVSLRPVGDTNLYPRAEIKNLNSFRSLESAIKYEIIRQKKLWNEGKHQDKNITVGWSDDKQQTYFLRDKEGADDYRYFPEPDLPPLFVSRETVEEYRGMLPELPYVRRIRYTKEYGMSEGEVYLLTENKSLAEYFEKTLTLTSLEPKKVASFITTVVIRFINEDAKDIEDCPVTPELLAGLLNAMASGKISNNMAKGEIFEEMYLKGKSADEIIKEKGLEQVSDTSEIEKIAGEVLAANPAIVAEYKSGKVKVFGFLVGQVMARMKGRANPGIVNDLVKKLLE
jgi:aspartyl-tRNA(Asn)/glutamyl-tRNA(Gln) amidotransferase subunit B